MKTILFAVMVAALPAGAYPVTIPIEGLTDANASDLKQRIETCFKGKAIDFKIDQIQNGHLTTYAACRGGFRLAFFEDALKGSAFSLKPETWELFGKVTLTWAPDASLKEEKRKAVLAALSKHGDVEILAERSKRIAYEARIVFPDKAAVAWTTLQETLAAFDIKDATMSWDNEDINGKHQRMECGARRIAVNKK